MHSAPEDEFSDGPSWGTQAVPWLAQGGTTWGLLTQTAAFKSLLKLCQAQHMPVLPVHLQAPAQSVRRKHKRGPAESCWEHKGVWCTHADNGGLRLARGRCLRAR